MPLTHAPIWRKSYDVVEVNNCASTFLKVLDDNE